jgi:hypothetical protein
LVGLGAKVGWGGGGWYVGGAGAVEVAEEGEDLDGMASLMDPSPARSDEDCSSGSPLGRSPSVGLPGVFGLDDTTALFVNCPGGWLTGLLQAAQTAHAAQTRAAATAVAAALAGATVPRIGMVPL